MEPIFPISALSKSPAEVRAAAETSVVRLTDNGRGKYVFATEEAYELALEMARQEAVVEQRMADVIASGSADVAAGRTYNLEQGRKLAAERRAARAKR